MQNQTSTTPPLSEQPPNKASNLAVKVLMWVFWLLGIDSAAIVIYFVYDPKETNNWFSSDLVWVMTGLICLSITLSLRFLLIQRVKNAWLKLLLFGIGLFVAQMAVNIGVLMFDSGQHTYLLFGIASILSYCPYWINLPNKKLNPTSNHV